jgi:hypothetical protein
MLESGADLSLEQQSKASGPWVSSYSYSLLGDDYVTCCAIQVVEPELTFTGHVRGDLTTRATVRQCEYQDYGQGFLPFT